jgi:hypothetical protein
MVLAQSPLVKVLSALLITEKVKTETRLETIYIMQNLSLVSASYQGHF